MKVNPDFDSRYQVLQPLERHQYRALKADIQLHGVLVPVEVDEVGEILDGHHRWRACLELGIPEETIPIVVRTGMSEAEKRTHARSLNAVRRQLTRLQKRDLIEQELHENTTNSNNSIAKRLGVSDVTVAKVRTELGLDSFVRIGADGKLYEYNVLDEVNQWVDEWLGMPDFEQDDLTPLKSLVIHFSTEEALEEFAALIEQRLTMKTKSTWFPQEDLEPIIDKRWADAT